MVSVTDLKNLLFDAFEKPLQHAQLYRKVWNNKILTHVKGCAKFFSKKLSFSELVEKITFLQTKLETGVDKEKLKKILVYILDQKQKHINAKRERIKNTQWKVVQWFLKRQVKREECDFDKGKKVLETVFKSTLTKDQADQVNQIVKHMSDLFFLNSTEIDLSESYLQSFKKQLAASEAMGEKAGRLFAEKVKSLAKAQIQVVEGQNNSLDSDTSDLPNWKNIANLQMLFAFFKDDDPFLRAFNDLTIRLPNETIRVNSHLLAAQCGYPFEEFKEKELDLRSTSLKAQDLSTFFHFLKTGAMPFENLKGVIEKLQFISGDCDVYFDYRGAGTVYYEKLELNRILSKISFSKPAEAGETVGYLWKMSRKYELKKDEISEFYYAQCLSIIAAYYGHDVSQNDKNLFIEGLKKALRFNYGKGAVELEFKAIKEKIDALLLESEQIGAICDYNIYQNKRVILIPSKEKRNDQRLNPVLLKAFLKKYSPSELHIEFPIATEEIATLRECVKATPSITNQVLFGSKNVVKDYVAAELNLREINDIGGILEGVEAIVQISDRIRVLTPGKFLKYHEQTKMWMETNEKTGRWEPFSDLICHYPHPFKDKKIFENFITSLSK